MTRAFRPLAVVAVLVLAAAAAAAWWLDARSRPDHVGPRFADSLVARHPGARVQPLDGDTIRVALPSGINVDVRIGALFDACRASRLRCADRVDAAVADVDRAEASARNPRREDLHPIVVGEPGGYRYGYVADPLVGPFEVRYALVDGYASSFATDAIVDRVRLTRGELRTQALASVHGDAGAALERVEGTSVYRVRADGDPAASLIDPDRMARFAKQIGSRRLFAAIPVRGVLLLAPGEEADAQALEHEATRLRGTGARTFDGGVLSYDTDAQVAQALTLARRSSVLRPPP